MTKAHKQSILFKSMERIDVRGSLLRRQTEGTLSAETEAEDGLVDIPFVRFSSPVKAELRYRIAEDGTVEVTGRVSFSLKGSCSRCLEETERRFEGDVHGLFERGAGNGVTYGYGGGAVEPDELIRDSVMFALPARLLCDRCDPDGDNE